MVDVEIDIDKDILFNLMLMAHERDITLNQLATEILEFYLIKKVSINEMKDGKTFDRIFADIINNGTIYTIYDDDSYTKALVVLNPYDECLK